MKKIIGVFLFVTLLGVVFFIDNNYAKAGYVSGYYRSNGAYVNGYYRSTPSYSSYKSYTPSYSSTRSYPSYNSGLRYQSGYYKPSTGSYVQGHYKTYSDGYTTNNRRNLYGY